MLKLHKGQTTSKQFELLPTSNFQSLWQRQAQTCRCLYQYSCLERLSKRKRGKWWFFLFYFMGWVLKSFKLQDFVADQRSTMLPILLDLLPGRRSGILSIFFKNLNIFTANLHDSLNDSPAESNSSYTDIFSSLWFWPGIKCWSLKKQ